MVDRGIFDSGCSGHMTGNKDHLDDFEECKGGSVTFGGSKGYITGKGRIKVGNLDFDSVSFVKELGHFNLFSISQICDKHHKVLFTETECLVVSPDFKMPDENQILLKVPRQHNMYSFDMKTPSLIKDYACLIAKVTSDESQLWHRRLGHINFKNLNKLVKGNLVRGLPSKVFRNDHTCVACHKDLVGYSSWLQRMKLVASLRTLLDKLKTILITGLKSLDQIMALSLRIGICLNSVETRVKYGNLPNRKMILSDSESEDATNSSKQGRNLGEEDVFETPKGKDSGEADISPSGLQAAETLVQVASQKTKTYTRRVKSGLKKKLDVGVSSGDRKFKSASEEIKSGFTNISFGEIREEEASLAEIARIQAQEAAEIERKAELQRLDALAAKRLNDEFEMSEQQRKRAAEVQQQAQYYTEEDWDLIRARMEASTELRKSVFGTDIDAEDYAKKMVELVEKRRREIREQKLKAKKNKPMTQAEQRNYMMNYVRSQSHGWTIPQLKKLSFEELKVQFERTIRTIENFTPMDSEKEKESLKRSGETLQGAKKKKQKVSDVEDIPIPESAKHGGKGYCHLIRANQRDSVFVNFGSMLHNFSRDDLVDLYKIVLQKTTAYGPEEDLERAFAKNLRIIFDPPQSEDTVWSLPMHIPSELQIL
ncbi:ribonuclease H-like domain-containing protein [Tanacetum coccineum]|uniref:Ribonuclease H-like domain-containing protein n=1 Tax=Tanacetum coccineum TaxID=301880 RepID=A0ABQ4XQ86_9ASTR